MFPVYSVTYVPGPYAALRSTILLDVLQGCTCRGLGRVSCQGGAYAASQRPALRNTPV